MKSVAQISVLGFLLLAAAACATFQHRSACETLFSDVSRAEINTDLTLSAPPSANNFKIGQMVNLVVDNNSKYIIEVAPDTDLMVYWLKDNSWVTTAQQMNYLGRVDRLSFPSGDDPGGGLYTAVFTPPASSPADICLVLRGVKDPDASRVKVAAFAEVTMYP